MKIVAPIRSLVLVSALAFAFAHPAHAADEPQRPPEPPERTGEAAIREIDRFEQERAAGIPRSGPPAVDANKRIKDSSSFLKEREPEMTTEEFAIHERVVTMLTTNVSLAVKMLEAMVSEKTPPSPAFSFILGNAYYAADQIDRAEKNYRIAIDRYPNFLRAWNNLGLLYYTTNRFPDAIACFSKAVTLGDRDPTTFGLLGYCLEKQGDVVSAEMAYMQALSGAPSNADWKEGLLRIYIDGKQFGRAEPLVRSLIKAKPKETRFWLNYAGILVASDRRLDAIAVLEQAKTAGAVGADELILLGDLYAEQNLATEAVAIYESVLGPARARGEERLLRFANMLTATGKFSQAEQTLAAMTGEPTSSGRLSLLQARADLRMAQKRWPDARKEIEALLAIAPLSGRALLTLGRTYLEEKDLPRATLAFEAAYPISESTYHASLELANVELKNRHYAKAVAYLEKALSIRKSAEVEDYLARVKTLVPTAEKSG